MAPAYRSGLGIRCRRSSEIKVLRMKVNRYILSLNILSFSSGFLIAKYFTNGNISVFSTNYIVLY